MLNSKEIEFILKNEGREIYKLILETSKIKGESSIDYKRCIKIIEAREKIKKKIPLWAEKLELEYPFALSIEQGSSQISAEYKAKSIKELLKKEQYNSADLTGGMGVDSYFIARYAATHYYFEQNTALYNATIENFKILGQLNIIGKNCNVTDDNCAAIRDLEDKSIDIIYIDPARRGDNNSKLIDIKDYSPNLLEILNPLLKVTKHILVKISPMADISYTLKQLPITTRVDIVAVDNECKELLFYLNRDAKEITNPIINCININSHNMRESLFSFTAEQERNSNSIFSNQINGYIYDANRAIIKGGAFKLIGERYNLNKIATNTHLYHSNVLIEEFPGRIYRLLEVLDFNKSTLKRLHIDYPMASIISKNFILDTNSLKRETKIKDGNNYYIIATTLNNNKKILLITQPL